MNTINIKKIMTFLLLAFICVVPSYAADTSHNHDVRNDHSTHGQQGAIASEASDKYFHQSHIEGYHLSYELIDMTEKVKSLDLAVTHHLMLNIAKDGNIVEPKKVGFLITAPDGKNQKAMAMTMGGGAGADIDLSQKGEYVIKVKAVVNGKNLLDSLKYTIK